jgi:hypothetical protein
VRRHMISCQCGSRLHSLRKKAFSGLQALGSIYANEWCFMSVNGTRCN